MKKEEKMLNYAITQNNMTVFDNGNGCNQSYNIAIPENTTANVDIIKRKFIKR